MTRNQIYSKTVILNKTSPAKLTYTSSHSYIKFLIILHIQSEISKKETVTAPTELTLKDISTTMVTWQQFAFCPEMYLIPGLIQLAELFTCTLLIHSIQIVITNFSCFQQFFTYYLRTICTATRKKIRNCFLSFSRFETPALTKLLQNQVSSSL